MKNYLATLEKYGLKSNIKSEEVKPIITDDDLDREFELFAKSLNVELPKEEK